MNIFTLLPSAKSRINQRDVSPIVVMNILCSLRAFCVQWLILTMIIHMALITPSGSHRKRRRKIKQIAILRTWYTGASVRQFTYVIRLQLHSQSLQRCIIIAGIGVPLLLKSRQSSVMYMMQCCTLRIFLIPHTSASSICEIHRSERAPVELECRG
jgi:hypothetical protein